MYNSKKQAGRLLILFAAFSLAFSVAEAQKKSKASSQASADTAKAKSMAQQAASKSPTNLKPYKEVVPATAKTIKSFFTLHLVTDRYLFEIPDSLLKKDILVVSRIDKAPAGFRLPGGYMSYAGDEVGQSVIEFEKIPGDEKGVTVIYTLTNRAGLSLDNFQQ